MGALAQTEAGSIAEMLAAPPSVPTYVALVFAAMGKANEGIKLAWDGRPIEAKLAVIADIRYGGGGLESAAGLNVYTDKMLRKLHEDGDISYELFDQLFRTFQMPLSSVVGEASVAIIGAKDVIARAINWVKSFFVTFENGAEIFFQQQAAGITDLHSGLEARSRAIQALIDSINRNKVYVPNTAKTLPDLGEILAEVNSAKDAFVKVAAEAEVTPEMIRGQTQFGGLGQLGLGNALLKKLAARAAKTDLLKKTMPERTLSKWLTPILMTFGAKKLTARGISKVLWFRAIGIPSLLWAKISHNTFFAVVLFTFGGFWLMKKFPNFFKEEIEKDEKVAVTPPAKKGVEDVRTKWDDLNRQTTEQINSARNRFPNDAALLDQGGDDTTWVLYALGGGALVIGLYLYFNRKSQTES